MLFLYVFILYFPSFVLSEPFISNFQKLNLPKLSVGPESLTFDSFDRGPYTGISDGRIVKYDKSLGSFVDFAFTTPNRSKAECDGSNNPALRPICGRTLGVDFYIRKNVLFIADAFRGLHKVGIKGGLATLIATAAEGIPFKFLNGLTVDQLTGDAYFSDFSSVFSPSEIAEAIASNDSTGRLLKYDYKTRKVTVLKAGLGGANGVALSLDRSYLLVAELIANRIRRYWLRGRRAFTSEIVATFNGTPDNIRRTNSGYFWVALNIRKSSGGQNITVPTAVKIKGNGKILKKLPLNQYYNATSMFSEFKEFGDKFYIGSVLENFVGVLHQ